VVKIVFSSADVIAVRGLAVLADAIQRYHDLLTDQVAADSQDHLDRQTERRQFYFGDRPICSVLRPRFLTDVQFRLLQFAVKDLLPAFQRVHERALKDAAFRKHFSLSEAEEQLFAVDPGYAEPSPTARFDSFFYADDELKFTEYNAETPAGAAYHDILTEIFYGMPVFQDFRRRYQVRPLPARPGVLDSLLDSFAHWAGNRSTKPRIAILDWNEVPTYSEFRLFRDFFTTHGLECRIIDPREVVYENGRLMHGDYHITLIYKRVLISELLEHGGFDHPVVRAVRDRAVCMVNSFRCKALYKKASLAVLSDEANAGIFEPAQRSAIERYIPWTRCVIERKTTFHGQPIDLVPFVLANRDRFVLKPNDDYGGKGIVLGWTVDATAWEAAVRTALASPYVVQEKVRLPREVFPGWHQGNLHLIERMLDTNPFVTFGRHMDGCLTRISTEALLNVTSGGGSTVPTFVVEER
jgi:hypothetical protein